MKNTFQYTCIVLFVISSLLISCDDWVESDFPSDQLGTEQVFNDVQTANAALGGLYVSLRNQSILSGNVSGTGAFLGSYTDDLDCYYNDTNAYLDIYLNVHQDTSTSIEKIWNSSYNQIYAANAIIHGIDNSTGIPSMDRNRIKGEALFIRTLLYLDLLQLFGEIPYTTSIDYEFNRSLGKTSQEELLIILESDIMQGISSLNSEYRDPERIYPNRHTAELLLAKIYLLQNKWSSAEQAALNIINSGIYQFQNDIGEVFHKTGSHIIWQLKPNNNNDSTHEASFYMFMDSAPLSYALSDDLVSSFESSDLRKTNWMAEVEFNGQSWYRAYKYKNLSGANTNEYSIVFRLEEVYFILAEALAKQSRIADALPYLNATRLRAGLQSLSVLSPEEFAEEFLEEKRREYFTEFGHRFFDLKRWGRLNGLTDHKANWQSFHERLPIPQKELLLNENLNPQNNGY